MGFATLRDRGAGGLQGTFQGRDIRKRFQLRAGVCCTLSGCKLCTIACINISGSCEAVSENTCPEMDIYAITSIIRDLSTQWHPNDKDLRRLRGISAPGRWLAGPAAQANCQAAAHLWPGQPTSPAGRPGCPGYLVGHICSVGWLAPAGYEKLPISTQCSHEKLQMSTPVGHEKLQISTQMQP